MHESVLAQTAIHKKSFTPIWQMDDPLDLDIPDHASTRQMAKVWEQSCFFGYHIIAANDFGVQLEALLWVDQDAKLWNVVLAAHIIWSLVTSDLQVLTFSVWQSEICLGSAQVPLDAVMTSSVSPPYLQ